MENVEAAGQPPRSKVAPALTAAHGDLLGVAVAAVGDHHPVLGRRIGEGDPEIGVGAGRHRLLDHAARGRGERGWRILCAAVWAAAGDRQHQGDGEGERRRRRPEVQIAYRVHQHVYNVRICLPAVNPNCVLCTQSRLRYLPTPMPAPRKPRKRPAPSSDLDRRLELLWGHRERPTRGPRPGMTLERIVAAAIEIARTRGVAELSMRLVASELGYTTMSLYRYVRSKDELLDLMVNAAVGEAPPLEDLPGDWRAKLERWARAEWAMFLRHPWALHVIARPLMGPGQMSWLEAGLRALASTGLHDGEKLETVALLDRYVRSAALDASRRAQDGAADWFRQWTSSLARFLTETERQGRYQTLARLMTAEQSTEPPGPDYELEFGLERVLDGIAALIDSPRGSGQQSVL